MLSKLYSSAILTINCMIMISRRFRAIEDSLRCLRRLLPIDHVWEICLGMSWMLQCKFYIRTLKVLECSLHMCKRYVHASSSRQKHRPIRNYSIYLKWHVFRDFTGNFRLQGQDFDGSRQCLVPDYFPNTRMSEFDPSLLENSLLDGPP